MFDEMCAASKELTPEEHFVSFFFFSTKKREDNRSFQLTFLYTLKKKGKKKKEMKMKKERRQREGNHGNWTLLTFTGLNLCPSTQPGASPEEEKDSLAASNLCCFC